MEQQNLVEAIERAIRSEQQSIETPATQSTSG